MADAIEVIAIEVEKFFEPLGLALESPEDFAEFLVRLGYQINPADIATAQAALTSIPENLDALVDLIETASEGGIDSSDVPPIITAAKPLFRSLASIDGAFDGLSSASLSAGELQQSIATLPNELFDLLLVEYLASYVPLAYQILAALEVLEVEWISDTGIPASRDTEYPRSEFRWDRLKTLFTDPETWARDAYGWGLDPDYDSLFLRFAEIVDYIGGTTSTEDFSNQLTQALWPHLPANPVRIPQYLTVPLFGEEAGDTEVEIGFGLFPVPGETTATRLTDAGIGIGPYIEGQAQPEYELGDLVTLSVFGTLQSAGDLIFVLRPSGTSLATPNGAGISGAFAVELKIAEKNAKPIVLLGSETGTRIQADAIVIAGGGDVDGSDFDLYAALGANNLQVVIDASGDGLLGDLLSGPITASLEDVTLGWRPGRGIYFDGGSAFGLTIPVNFDTDVVNIDSASLSFDLSDPFTVAIGLTGDLRLGPLFLAAEGIGVQFKLIEAEEGILGDRDLDFAFKAPSGYAVALDNGPISGGGTISVFDHEYRGALALQFEKFGFSAFAILNSQLENGAKGYSFAASIFGTFNVPLGYGFFLTGVGGFLGINRTILADEVRRVLYEGRLDNLLFPSDPIGSARTILADMAAILPVASGQHVVGPVARISWGKPTLINVTLGVLLEFGEIVGVDLVGSVTSVLPSKDKALVHLTYSFYGEIDFGQKSIAFDGSLTGSRVLSWTVDGDTAIRTGWGGQRDHIASFGGFHPAYPRPANWPHLRRLSINFGTNNPKITLSGYTAITFNSLQFGAEAYMYAKGPKIRFIGRVAAEGEVYFHALIYFDPFGFDIALGGEIRLLVNGKNRAELGFSLNLSGPNTYRIRGKVWVKICRIKVKFGVNHTWGSEKTLPTPKADPAVILVEALESNLSYEVVPPETRRSGVNFVDDENDAVILDPIGGIRFVQRAVPLGIQIEKVGEAQVVGNNIVDIEVRQGGVQQSPEPENLEFVRGHFFQLSEPERLRSPEIEEFKAGFEVSSTDLEVDVQKAIREEYAYEVIRLPPDDARDSLAPVFTNVAFADDFVRRWSGNYLTSAAQRGGDLGPVTLPDDRTAVRGTLYAPLENTEELAGFTDAQAVAETSDTSAVASNDAGRVVADYLLAS